jgi:hypothetical protein
MTGKGSGRRPTAHDKPNAYQDGWELAFKKRKPKPIMTIEIEIEGSLSTQEVNDHIEKLIKEDKLVFKSTTKYINA